MTVAAFLMLALLCTSAEAGRRHGGRRGQPGTPPATPAATAASVMNPADPPSINLNRFITAHFHCLSSISGNNQPDLTAYRTDLSLLSSTLQAQKNLPEKREAAEAGLRICSLLATAIDEHDKTAAQFAAAQSVAGPRDVKDVRISTVRARRGYGRATRANNAKEATVNNQGGSNDGFMNSAAVNAWTTRLAELRRQIDVAYAQEVAIEHGAAAKRAPPTAAPSPITSSNR